MRMRQSIADIERAFEEQAEADRQRREALVRQAQLREVSRQREKVHKRGALRFWLLVLVLSATAVAVTVAMFETLYFVMG
jgi:hypothetical protein